jgi:hypothetical protein
MVGYAQNPISTLEQLLVEIWPDFDQPSVLVLLTGAIPEDVPLPVEVTLPIPLGATINAVARVTSDDIRDDIEFDAGTAGQLTFTVPNRRFQAEYYIPYTADGNRRNYTFNWLSDLTIAEFLVRVQQPSLATSMTMTPAATNVSTGAYGLQYHHLAASSLSANQPFSLEIGYELVRSQLSIEVVETQPTLPNEPGDPGFNWPIMIAVAGGATILVAAVWFVMSNRRPKRRTIKPKPTRRATPRRAVGPAPKRRVTRSNFCHECGQPADPDDRFCSKCGTALKGK